MRRLRIFHFPQQIEGLLRGLSEVGFFERSLLIGSWVMPLYKELYGVLIGFSELVEIEDFTIRTPIPESYFIHKLIVAPRRRTGEKRQKDINQCAVLVPILSDERLYQVMQAQRIAKATKRRIEQSCKEIGFPLQRLFP